MQLSRGRWVAIGLLVLVVALIGHGRTLVTEPVEVQRHYVDAVWLSVGVGTTLLFGVLALVVYLTAFAVFTLRASDHYERWSA